MRQHNNYHILFNEETLQKLEKIAEKEKRSINKQLEHIAQTYINKYEKINGEIKI